MQRLTNMHVQRWQQHKHLVGTGHVYQGRYKSFPVETDEYFYQVVRYVERNALRRLNQLSTGWLRLPWQRGWQPTLDNAPRRAKNQGGLGSRIPIRQYHFQERQR